MKNRGNNPGFLCINAWQKINMSKMYKTLFLTDWKCCGIVFKDGKGYVQAGAGIVADSVPAKEYMETKNKALAVINAIKEAAKL